jgi:hypothetical protein
VFPWSVKSQGPPSCLHIIVFIRFVSFYSFGPQPGRVESDRDLLSALPGAVFAGGPARISPRRRLACENHRSTDPSCASPILIDAGADPNTRDLRGLGRDLGSCAGAEGSVRGLIMDGVPGRSFVA